MKLLIKIITLALLSLSTMSRAQQDYQPVWKPDSSSAFEVGTQLRPWTIADEGMETIFENFSMAGVNAVYFLAVMHKEHRPFQADKFPHNPVRSSFQAEDSRVAFFPDWDRYGKIKPIVSDHKWINETDWLQLTIDECRKRGMKVGTEVSHYPIPKEMLKANPDWLQKDINGDSPVKNQFCPNNPDVREYLLALYSDLAANYDLDYIQTCQYVFSPNDLDNGGGCFCEHCIKEAAAHGIDLEALRVSLKKDKTAQPMRTDWVNNRCRVAAELFFELSEVIKEENPACHLRLNDVYSHRKRDPLRRGIDIKAISPSLGSLVNQDHTEQYGESAEYFDYRKEWLETNRSYLGHDKPLICGIAPRIKATPGLVKQGIDVAIRNNARIDGIAIKHYDGASYSLLRAVKQGLIEAGVNGLTPIMGYEIEDMGLEGYVLFETELAEEWGVETSSKGRVEGVFDYPSGNYDIRITYFDAKRGESPVTLFIESKEVVSFKMDKNTDCWRWHKFKKIKIKKGDKIRLVGENHLNEKARLDFIEFIPLRTNLK